ncbi:MAG: Outer membrane porin OmpC [uncultured Caballeronia sp.]|nr:MAG: Outer membrane porin OmpC [uncultured Caballeronia sp.]
MEGYNISLFGSGYAIHQGDFDRMNGDRLPNSIKYVSPRYQRPDVRRPLFVR